MLLQPDNDGKIPDGSHQRASTWGFVLFVGFPIFEAYIYIYKIIKLYIYIYNQQLFGDLCLLDFGCCCPQWVYLGFCFRWLFRHLRLLFASKQQLLGHLCLLSLWLLLSAVHLLGDLVVCLRRHFRFNA